MVYVERNLIDSYGGMYLTFDSLTEINKIITSSNNITLRKLKVKQCGFHKTYMDKELIEDYQIIDQINERKITSTMFYSKLWNKIHPFFDENDRTCKIPFGIGDIIRQNR